MQFAVILHCQEGHAQLVPDSIIDKYIFLIWKEMVRIIHMYNQITINLRGPPPTAPTSSFSFRTVIVPPL